MIDLLNIAKTEANGNLFNELSNIFEKADIKPEGYPDAVVWQGGNHDGKINPVAHSLTDAYALWNNRRYRYTWTTLLWCPNVVSIQT